MSTVKEIRIQSESLHELNAGEYLDLFGKKKTMKIGFVVNKDPKEVKIYKHIEMVLNTKYHVNVICIRTGEGVEKTIEGHHSRYRIREGKHSVPLKNITDRDDLRSTYCYVEIEIESIGNQKVDLFAVTVFLRKSIL